MVVLTQAPYLVVRHFRAGHFGTYFAVAPGQVAVGAPPDSQCTGPMCPVFAQPRGVTLEFFLLRGGVLAAVDDTEIRVHGSILRVGARSEERRVGKEGGAGGESDNRRDNDTTLAG